MNEQTAKLLEQLAGKLGTTSEYLWGILLKQAPIDATITLFQTAVVVLITYVMWKKVVGAKKDDDDFMPVYIIVAILWSIFCFITLCFSGSIINGYFNPEYWALERILQSLNPCN